MSFVIIAPRLSLATEPKSNLYDVLGVTQSTTDKELKRAYRKRARELHPDKQPKERKAEFEAKFIELANAYEVLSNPDTRREYDSDPHGFFSKDGGSPAYDDFESAFQRHGFDGASTVDDTPLNRLVVFLMLLSLAAPALWVGVNKLMAKPAQSASRAQLLQSLAPKSKEDEARKLEAEKREARRRENRRNERNIRRKHAAERTAAEVGAVPKADIKAYISYNATSAKSGSMPDTAPGAARRAATGHTIIKDASEPWSKKEDALLLSACKKYVGGTPQRWEKVASFVGTRDKSGVLQRVKKLKIRLVGKSSNNEISRPRGGNNDREATEKGASSNSSVSEERTSPRPAPRPWTKDEQSRLEMALKTVPSSLEKNERWTQISNLVGTRTKVECVKRFRELRKFLREGNRRKNNG